MRRALANVIGFLNVNILAVCVCYIRKIIKIGGSQFAATVSDAYFEVWAAWLGDGRRDVA